MVILIKKKSRVVVVLLAFLSAPASRADSADITVGLEIAAGVASEALGMTFAVGNLYYALEGEKPSAAWINGGYICSALNITTGALMIYMYSRFSDDNHLKNVFLGLGISQFSVAAMDIGFALWSSSQPEKTEQKVTVAPLIMSDARDRPAFGIGLQLVGW